MPDADGWESGLSPSEQLILDYVRQGMRDAEIAVRLGVSVGDGKARIDALIRKTGVRDRDDLADWSGRAEAPFRSSWSRPAEPVAVESVQMEGPGEGRLVVLDEDAGPRVSGLGPRLPHLLFTASVAVAGIALLVVSTDGPAVTGEHRSDLRRDLVGSLLDDGLIDNIRLAGDANPIPTPQYRDGVALSVPRQAGHIDVPLNVALLISTRCSDCPFEPSLFRIYRTPDRGTVIERLPPLPAGDGPGGPLFWTSSDGSEAVALPYESRPDGVVTRLYRSRDGFQTWEEAGEVAGIGFGVRAVGPDHVLIEDGAGRKMLLPDGRPFDGSDEKLVPWSVDPGGWIRTTPPPTFQGRAGVASADGTRMLVSPPFDEVGDVDALFLVNGGVVELGYDSTVFWPVAALGDTFVAQASFTRNGLVTERFAEGSLTRPVLFEPRLGRFHPFTLPRLDSIDERHWSPFAVQRGPFLRVASSDCAALHAQPQVASDEVACAAPDVLLTTLDERDGDWQKVRTPAGVEGWVSNLDVE